MLFVLAVAVRKNNAKSAQVIRAFNRRHPRAAAEALSQICHSRQDVEGYSLVSVHRHPLRAPAQLTVSSRADGPAATSMRAALLECEQLLGTESLVVDLGRCLDEILEVSAQQEVPQVDELAVVLVLDVDDAPAVLAAADLLAVNDDRVLGADDSEGNHVLRSKRLIQCQCVGRRQRTYLDLRVQNLLLIVELFILVRVHLQVVERKLLLDAGLELLTLLEGERVGLGNDGDDVDDIGQLLQDDNVDGLQGVAGGLDEEEAAVDAGILDVALTLGCELLAQVGGVLILDVLDDGVPATVVVDQVAVAGGVDDVEPQTDAVLLNDVRNALDLGCGADGLVGLQATLGVDEVRGEDGVDEGRLAESGLACKGDMLAFWLLRSRCSCPEVKLVMQCRVGLDGTLGPHWSL